MNRSIITILALTLLIGCSSPISTGPDADRDLQDDQDGRGPVTPPSAIDEMTPPDETGSSEFGNPGLIAKNVTVRGELVEPSDSQIEEDKERSATAEFTLNWQPPDNPPSPYFISVWRKFGHEETYQKLASLEAVTAYIDRSLPGITHCYRLQGSDGEGNFGYSPEVCERVQPRCELESGWFMVIPYDGCVPMSKSEISRIAGRSTRPTDVRIITDGRILVTKEGERLGTLIINQTGEIKTDFSQKLKGINTYKMWSAGKSEIFIATERYLGLYDVEKDTLQELVDGNFRYVWGIDNDNIYAVEKRSTDNRDHLFHIQPKQKSRKEITISILPSLADPIRPLPETEISSIDQIWGTAADNLYIVSNKDLLLHYNGESWKRVDELPHSIAKREITYRIIGGVAANDIYVVQKSTANNTSEYTIYHYNGSTWKPKVSGDEHRSIVSINKDGTFLHGIPDPGYETISLAVINDHDRWAIAQKADDPDTRYLLRYFR